MYGIVFLLVAALQLVSAEDFMAICYATYPDNFDHSLLCFGSDRRVLRALEGAVAPVRTTKRRQLANVGCGEYCADWGADQFCMEYKCT
jgi:hypothetical protein